MSSKFAIPRGTTDILPALAGHWQNLERKARCILEIYGYREIRTPIFEETGLFIRSLGQTTDVVQKQMLTLAGDKEDSFSLRPEGTASIVRSYVENSLDKKQNLNKFYYVGPMFRGERPQRGRLRQFHQIGVEAIGTTSPLLDAEVIVLAMRVLKECGIEGCRLRLNSLGTPEDKKNFSDFLRRQLKERHPSLCEDCRNRFERNIFRILDCKNESCRNVVKSIDLHDAEFSVESRQYFTRIQLALDSLQVEYTLDPLLVRGLDYYTHTVFEISHPGLGSQDAIGAGGRYDNLVEELGGPKVGAVGFALGLERMLLAQKDTQIPFEYGVDVFVVSFGDLALQRAVILLNDLRRAGISSEMSYEEGSSFKSQLRLADKQQAKYVVFIGEDELKAQMATVKDMASGSQEKIPLEKVVEVLLTRDISNNARFN